jgi:hypothetical protein
MVVLRFRMSAASNREVTFLKSLLHVAVAGAFCAAIGLAAPATAQQPAPDATTVPQQAGASAPGQQPPDCGTWQSGTWVPTGACGADDYRSHVSGTVTAVKGHLVTLQQATQSMIINDQPALEKQETGKVAVGRQVLAVGYWRSGTFYATNLRTIAPNGPKAPTGS